MVEINHADRSMRAKIVYYGSATGGKTTNLQVIHSRSKQDRDLDLFSVDTSQNRTILFDLLPMSTPAFRNYELRFQILGVPGQKLYATTRKMLLKNADSVVFVANSAADRWDESIESYKEMSGFLLKQGIDPTIVPMVFQYNKRDLGDTVDIQVMERALNSRGASHFPAVASQEKRVLETFASALKATMSDLAKRYRIASELTNAQSIDEWAEQTMLLTFGVLRFDDNSEASLPHFEAFREEDPLPERVLNQILVGVSTRNYESSLDKPAAKLKSRGTSKSAASRHLVSQTTKKLEEYLSRRLEEFSSLRH